MNLSDCRDFDFVKKVIFDDWDSASSDGMTKNSFNPHDYEWLQIEVDGKRIGVWAFEAKSNICAGIHLYLLKEFRGHWENICDPLVDFVKENTSIRVLVAEIPSNRKNTRMCALRGGFQKLASIPESVIENDELADIDIFTRTVSC